MEKQKKIKALVVDDYPSMRKALKEIIERKNMEVIESENGLFALEVLKKERIDIIFSDIVMPEMDGFELCQAVKGDKKYRSIPIIMTSTQTDSNYVMKALRLGADDYIIKPVKENIIDKVIKRVTNG